MRVAAVQFGHAGDVITLWVSLDDDVESAFHGGSVAEIPPFGEDA